MAEPLLSIRNLNVGFDTGGEVLRAVRDLSVDVLPGQTVALVGESGCGKSVTALAVMRLLSEPPGRVLCGEVWFDGRNLLALPEHEMRRMRGRDIAMIFQEPMTSLNPVLTIGDQISEAVSLHQEVSAREAYRVAEAALRQVGIAEPASRMRDYPHQMSGGMRQRVMIAMALSCRPRLLIADEPTTALDVTIQAQILDLLRRLRRETGMALLLITHDLGVVAENADVVGVMYAGRLVELGGVEHVLADPRHPYTRGLLRSMPRLGAKARRLETIPGVVPAPGRLPLGCAFFPRCVESQELAAKVPGEEVAEVRTPEQSFRVMRQCTATDPPWRETSPGHSAACHYADRADRLDAPDALDSRGNIPEVDR